MIGTRGRKATERATRRMGRFWADRRVQLRANRHAESVINMQSDRVHDGGVPPTESGGRRQRREPAPVGAVLACARVEAEAGDAPEKRQRLDNGHPLGCRAQWHRASISRPSLGRCVRRVCAPRLDHRGTAPSGRRVVTFVRPAAPPLPLGRSWADARRHAPATRSAATVVSQKRPSGGFGDMHTSPSASRTLSCGAPIPLRGTAARRCPRAEPSKGGPCREGGTNYTPNYGTNYRPNRRRIRGRITLAPLGRRDLPCPARGIGRAGRRFIVVTHVMGNMCVCAGWTALRSPVGGGGERATCPW